MNGRNDIGSLRLVNALYFLAILFIGIYFGKERSVMYDGAFSIFVLSEHLSIPVADFRITAGFHSLMPLLVALAGGKMQYILYAYVINYLVLPVLVFFFMAYRSSHLKYQTTFLIAFSLFNASAFFIAVHDYWVGYYLLFPLFRLLDDDEIYCKTTTRHLLSALLILLILLSHINTFVSIVFLLWYLYLKKRLSRRYFASYMLLVFLFIIAKLWLYSSPYEQHILDVGTFSFLNIFELLRSATFTELIQSFMFQNLNFLILFIAVTIFNIFRRKILTQSLLVLEIAFSVLLLCYFFPHYGYLAYTEGYLKSMNILLAIIGVDVLYQFITRYRASLAILSVNYFFSFMLMISSGNFFKSRYQFIASSAGAFNTSVLIHTEADMSPLPFMFFPLESSIINIVENGSAQYINLKIRGDELNIRKQREFAAAERGRYFKMSEPAADVVAEEISFPVTRLLNDNKFSFHYFDKLRPLEE